MFVRRTNVWSRSRILSTGCPQRSEGNCIVTYLWKKLTGRVPRTIRYSSIAILD